MQTSLREELSQLSEKMDRVLKAVLQTETSHGNVCQDSGLHNGQHQHCNEEGGGLPSNIKNPDKPEMTPGLHSTVGIKVGRSDPSSSANAHTTFQDSIFFSNLQDATVLQQEATQGDVSGVLGWVT